MCLIYKTIKKWYWRQLNNNVDAFQFASPELKQDKQFIMSLAHDLNSIPSKNVQQKGATLFRWVAPEVHQDKEFVHHYSTQFPLSLEWIPELASDKKIVEHLVSINGNAIKYASSELKEDIEVIRLACNQSPKAILYVSPRLREDKGFMIDIISREWECLQYAGHFTNDRDIVSVAIARHAYAIQYASNELQNNKDIVMQAVIQDGRCIIYLKKKFGIKEVYNAILYDKDVIMTAVSQNGDALEFVPPQFKADKEVIFTAIKTTPTAIEYIETSPVWDDPLFLEEIVKIIPLAKGKADNTPLKLQSTKEELLFHGPVIISTTSHGKLLPPFHSPFKVERHIASDFGTCVFYTPGHRKVINSIVQDTLDMQEIITRVHTYIVNRPVFCVDDVPIDLHPEYADYCKSKYHKKIKQFQVGDKIFNKEFTYKGEPTRQIIAKGKDSTGKPLIHILSNYKSSWTLKDIMIFVKSIGATELILFDFSCSMYNYSEADFKKYGGKTKQRKQTKRKQTKRKQNGSRKN